MTALSRRDFMKGSAAVAGGLVVGCQGNARKPARNAVDAATFDAWLRITPDDRILLYVDKVEMGQGTMTGFATLVGEELEVAPERIEVLHAPVDGRYRDPAPMQGTGGSTSLVERFTLLREGGARARFALESAGAERLGVDRSEMRAQDGRVVHADSGRSFAYGELADEAAQVSVPRTVALKPPERFRFIGADRPRVDGPVKSRGQAEYGMDTQLPGLLTAVVVRPPRAGDHIASFDSSEALAMPGVEDVFEIPTGVAVVADGYWRARKAAGVLKFEVAERPDEPRFSSAEIRAEQSRQLREESGKTLRKDGDVERALDEAGTVIDVEYYTTHQAHATMEPMNCTIVPDTDPVEVHIGTQAPDIVQDVVADVLGRRRADVVVHTKYLGGGFGRRFFPDVAAEAAEIAKRVGRPVKLVYSREDDMARDYYRPATGHRFRGAVDFAGTPVAWEHRLVAPSMLGYMASRMAGALAPAWLRGPANWAAEGTAGWLPRFVGPMLAHEGAEDQPYDVPNVRVESLLYDPGIQVGIWRSVGHSNNGFVVESFVDELAHAAGQDPAAFRRRLLDEHPRHVACLDLVTEKAGWGSAPAGRHHGIAVHEAFGTVVAEVAEVSVDASGIHVERVIAAVHCGLAVNPDIVRAQIESGIVFGLTAALKSEVTFDAGVANETNFHQYAMLRMNEAPRIEVHIVPSADPPTGVGEPGTPPIAAAVANAVFAGTGVRLRELPLRMPTSDV